MGEARTDPDALGRHLVTAGLAGAVATSVDNCLDNIGRLLAGRPGYTFGLSDWKDATFDEVVAAMRAAGGRPDDPAPGAGRSAFIDPAAAVAAIGGHRTALDRLRAAGSGRVIVATGHPFALLAHYGAVARALEDAGVTVLRPLEGAGSRLSAADGKPCSVRYLDGVACLFRAVALQHTHHPHYM
ncbi:MAG: phosphatase, partial [Actinomycetota bacterium]|nr:phosphatase [Actinomycetota bacterium]